MSRSADVSERLRVLVDAVCTSEIGQAELQELSALLRRDGRARRFYAAYCRMHAELYFAILRGAGRPNRPPIRRPRGLRVWGSGPSPTLVRQLNCRTNPKLADPEPLIPPIIIDTSGPSPSPVFSLHSPLGGWLFSYAAATVITGVAILGAWVYKVSLTTSRRGRRRPAAGRLAGTTSRSRSPSAGSPARPIAAGPIRKTPRRRRRPPGPQVRVGLRPDGNHLPDRGQSHPPRAVHLRSRFRRRRLPLAGQADGKGERRGSEGQRSGRIRHQKSPIPYPLSPICSSALPPPSSPTWAPSSAWKSTRRAPPRRTSSAAR